MKLSTRAVIFVAAFILLTAVTAYGSTQTLSRSDAQTLNSQVQSIPATAPRIFANNVKIALTEFIPLFGFVFGVYVSYDTGTVIAAESQANPQADAGGLELFLFLMLTPIFWLEFFSYSLALEESISVVVFAVAIIISYVKKRPIVWTEWKWLVASIITVAIVLFFSAKLEASIVGAFIPSGG